jgi:hypothetical protein
MHLEFLPRPPGEAAAKRRVRANVTIATLTLTLSQREREIFGLAALLLTESAIQRNTYGSLMCYGIQPLCVTSVCALRM